MEDKEQEEGELIEEQDGEIEPKEEIELMNKVIEEIIGKLDKRDALILKQKEGDIKHADKQVIKSKEKWDNGMAKFPEEFETYGDFKRAKDVIEKYDKLLKQIRDELEFFLIILNEQIDKEKKAYMTLSKSSSEIEEIRNKSKLEIKEILKKSKEKNEKKQEKINRLKEEVNKFKKTKKIHKENQKLKEKNKKLRKEKKKLIKKYNQKLKELIKKYNQKLKEIKKGDMKKKDYKISPKMEEAYRRFNDGEKQVDIAEDMGMDKHTINKWIQKVKISNEQKRHLNKKITSKIQEKT